MDQAEKSSGVAKWTYEIDRYDKRMDKWTRRSTKIIKRYADERGGVAEQKESRYNALWSNIQTLSPALYVKLPKPEIDRRYKDADPVGRLSSELLQRCASFSLTADTHAVFRQVLLDYLLTARGTAWVRYVPHFRDLDLKGTPEVKDDGDELADDAEIPDDPKRPPLSGGASAAVGTGGAYAGVGRGGASAVVANGGAYAGVGRGGATANVNRGGASAAVRDGKASAGTDPASAEAGTTNAGNPRLKTDQTVQEVIDEEVIPDYVHWKDFGHTEGRTWEEVRAVWRIAYLGRDALVERFGKATGAAIPLNWGAKDSDTDEDKQNRDQKAAIYEIWDKTNRTVLWICKDHPDVLDERDDPLGLSRFFPCPKPLYATLTNEKLEPIPDYAMYQDQAIQLDDLTARITSITKSLKVAGVFDASAQGIQRLLNEGVENQLIPVESWAAFAEKGGLKGAVEFLPVADIAQTLLHLYECREKVKGDMYEITGLSDIVRGDTDAGETASAQRIKGQYAGVRMQDRRNEVQRFIRDTINLMVEVIAGHFAPDTLKKMSGLQMFDTAAEKSMAEARLAAPLAPPTPFALSLSKPVLSRVEGGAVPTPFAPSPVEGGAVPLAPTTPFALSLSKGAVPAVSPAPSEELQQKLDNPTWDQVVALIRDDTLRSFRIDIETDSTIAADEAQEKKDRIEMLTAVGGYLEKMIPAAESNPPVAPLLAQMLMFGVRSFRIGRQLEGDFETFIAKLQKSAALPQPPKPDPEIAKVQARVEAEGQAAQAELQLKARLESAALQQKAALDAQTAIVTAKLEAQKAANEMHVEQARLQLEAQQSAHLNQLEAQREALTADHQARLEQMRLAQDGQIASVREKVALLIAKLETQGRIEVAEIGAKAALDAAQLTAARAATEENAA